MDMTQQIIIKIRYPIICRPDSPLKENKRKIKRCPISLILKKYKIIWLSATINPPKNPTITVFQTDNFLLFIFVPRSYSSIISITLLD